LERGKKGARRRALFLELGITKQSLETLNRGKTKKKANRAGGDVKKNREAVVSKKVKKPTGGGGESQRPCSQWGKKQKKRQEKVRGNKTGNSKKRPRQWGARWEDANRIHTQNKN